VVISADATPGRVERLQESGACAYLTKPLDVDRFLETVDRIWKEAPALATQRTEKCDDSDCG
jgi:AmiR/NasT family two-component response regulator